MFKVEVDDDVTILQLQDLPIESLKGVIVELGLDRSLGTASTRNCRIAGRFMRDFVDFFNDTISVRLAPHPTDEERIRRTVRAVIARTPMLRRMSFDVPSSHLLAEMLRDVPWARIEELNLRFSVLDSVDKWLVFPSLTGLTRLSVRGPISSVEISSLLPSLTALTHLDINGSVMQATISLGALPKNLQQTLKHLKLHHLRFEEGILPLNLLTAMTSLDINYTQHAQYWTMPDVVSLTACTALEALRLGYFTTVADLSPFTALTALRDLELRGFDAVTDLAPLSALSALRTVELAGFTSVTDVTPLSRCRALESVSLCGFDAVTSSLPPLNLCTALKRVELYAFRAVVDLGPWRRWLVPTKRESIKMRDMRAAIDANMGVAAPGYDHAV